MTRLYIFAALGIGCFLAGGTAAWNVQGWRMDSEIADLRSQHAEAARAAEASARAKEQAAATTLATIEQKARDEQKRLSADLAALDRELRNRPQRPSGGDLSKSPSNSVGCTGTGLFAADAAFLVRESSRADKLRIDLARCQAAYDSAVKLTSP